MKRYYCPMNDFTCPYFNELYGICTLPNASEECDAFALLEEENFEVKEDD